MGRKPIVIYNLIKRKIGQIVRFCITSLNQLRKKTSFSKIFLTGTDMSACITKHQGRIKIVQKSIFAIPETVKGILKKSSKRNH